MKEKFIEELGLLLKKYKVNNIMGMSYEKDLLGDECLYVFYDGGHIKNINVTMDSISSIIKDLCKQGGLD